MSDVGAHFVETALEEYRKYKASADKALAQVSDEEFFRATGPEDNSLALVVKHVAGNLRSRWSDFLTTDGEKPDRARDGEFEIRAGDTRESLMARWEAGWRAAFGSIGALSGADAMRAVVIRFEPHTVVQALVKNLAHTAQHVGQILWLAKHLRGSAWTNLSVPRGASERILEEMRARFEKRA